MIRHLEPVRPVRRPDPDLPGGDDHPMRIVTREVARDASSWTPQRRAEVAALFEELAGEWHTRDRPGREAPLLDALQRGDVGGGTCLELGAGTGIGTRDLARAFGVVAVDLAGGMLDLFPRQHGWPVAADAASLPHPDDAVDAVALQNALLFPAEVDRVLRPGGVVIWVNSRGEHTPIHLPAEEVADVLPGDWDGVASRAGEGTWCVLRRVRTRG